MCSKHTYFLVLVHVCDPVLLHYASFERVVNLFDHIYPSIKIDCIATTEDFDPEMEQWLSKSMNVPIIIMSMRQPLNGGIYTALINSANCCVMRSVRHAFISLDGGGQR